MPDPRALTGGPAQVPRRRATCGLLLAGAALWGSAAPAQLPVPYAPPAPSVARTDVATFSYAPSYVQTDRALAALKALGYTVIEFSAQPDALTRDRIFLPQSVIGLDTPLPAIVKLPDAEKSSLMDPPPPAPQAGGGLVSLPQQVYGPTPFPPGQSGPQISAVPDIGGSYLHNVTAAGAEQRLLIVHDPKDPAPLARLLHLLQSEIDLPARQVVIEALVIEVNRDRIRDLGLEFDGTDGRWSGSFLRTPQDQQLPLILGFDDALLDVMGSFRARLHALLTQGEAEVLSNPSVLVMDGRQARIQIGQQIPISNVTTNFGSTQESIQYFPVGIVLNLRPRISADQKEVSMQVETIVSSVNASGAGIRTESGALRAPVVDNRQVQTFVRVADNTPFIVGGLIATETSQQDSAVPGLSAVPLLGALFKRRTTEKRKSEVIVVLTPHIAPQDNRNFSYTRPKDSAAFDSTDHRLFRDNYRIRSREVFDLAYLRDSAALRELATAARRLAQRRPELAQDRDVAALLEGGIPGEDILVRRMLWETIRNSAYAQHVDLERIVLFQREPGPASGYRLSFLRDLLAGLAADEALVLRLTEPAAGQFEQPAALAQRMSGVVDHARLVEEQNREAAVARSWALVLQPGSAGARAPLEWLRGALVLKKIVDLNSTLPLRISEFYAGRQILYPTAEDLSQGFQILDVRAAQYWYEIQHYYPAFEREFNRVAQRVAALERQLQPAP